MLFVARVGGGLAAGMAYPTTLALITALWVGAGADEVDRALVGHRRRDRRARARCSSGLLLEHFWWGSVFLITLPLAVGRARDGAGASCRRTSTRRPSRSTTSAASSRCVLVGALILAINFAPVPNEGTLVLGLAADRGRRRWSPSYIRQRRAKNPLYDLARRRAAHLLGRGLRRDHRVRLADGRDVHRPAVPAERARLLDARRPGRRSCRPRSAWCWSRRARPSSSRRAAPASRCSSATSFCLLGFLTMLLLWKEDISYWKVGLGYAFVGIGVGLRRHAGLALADRLGAGAARRDGVGHGRPAARPRRRDHAVDLRRAAHGRLRGGDAAAIARRRASTSPTASRAQLDEVVRRRRGRSRSSTRSTRARSPPRRRRRSCRATSGPTPPASSRSCSARRSSSSCSRRRSEEEQLLAQYHAEDTKARAEHDARPGPPVALPAAG